MRMTTVVAYPVALLLFACLLLALAHAEVCVLPHPPRTLP